MKEKEFDQMSHRERFESALSFHQYLIRYYELYSVHNWNIFIVLPDQPDKNEPEFRVGFIEFGNLKSSITDRDLQEKENHWILKEWLELLSEKHRAIVKRRFLY